MPHTPNAFPIPDTLPLTLSSRRRRRIEGRSLDILFAELGATRDEYALTLEQAPGTLRRPVPVGIVTALSASAFERIGKGLFGSTDGAVRSDAWLRRSKIFLSRRGRKFRK